MGEITGLAKAFLEQASTSGEEVTMCPPAAVQFRIECNNCGACCKEFTLPWSWERIEANKMAALRGDPTYQYADADNVRRQDSVNAMMAAWAPHLLPIKIPAIVKAMKDEEREGFNFGLYWYSCTFAAVDRNGKNFCVIHGNRPKVCAGYQPEFQGGYIRNPDQILYMECSYRQKWPREENGNFLPSAVIANGQFVEVGETR